MPFINVKTNIPVSENAQEALKTRLGQAIEAIPGKSEAWLMVGVEPECALWFQGTDAPAALVEVSVYGGAEPDAQSLLEAAQLAAYFSQGRESANVPVDYTPVKFVKKPAGARPGMVVYTTYNTLLADPDAALVKKLSVK